MANSGTFRKQFPNTGNATRPAFNLELRISRSGVSGNSSRWSWSLWAVNPNRWSLSFDLNSYSWSVTVLGQSWSGTASAFDFRGGQSQIQIASGTTSYVSHSSTGSLNVTGSGAYGGGSIFGRATASGSFRADTLISIPSRPPAPTIVNTTSERARIRYNSLPSNVTRAQIRWAKNSGMSGASVVTDTTDLSTDYYLGGLTRATTYYFQVRYLNAAGWSQWSPSAVATTKPTVPDRPQMPVIVSVAPTSITVEVQPNSNGGAALAGPYGRIGWSLNSDYYSDYQEMNISGPGQHTIPGLQPDTTYYIRWRVHNSVGWSSNSYQVSTTTSTGIPGGTGLSLSTPSPSTLVADWDAPSYDGGGIIHYEVQVATNSSMTANLESRQVAPGATELTLSDRTNGVRYYVRVRAVSATGAGPWSPVRNALVNQAPPAPTLLDVTPAPLGTIANVSWSTAPAYEGTPVLRYEVQSTRQGQTFSIVRDAGLATSLVVEGLNPGVTYTWRVRAVNAAGASAWSNSITAAQPSLDIVPGAYFDGDTPDTPDVDYEWLGDANLSESRAVAAGVAGWQRDGGVAGSQVYSVRSQRMFGARAAAITFDRRTRLGDLAVGIGGSNSLSTLASVEPDADVTASVYVRAPRTNSVALELRYFDASGTLISREVVGGRVVAADVWTRVSGTGHTPANAEYANFRLVNHGGSYNQAYRNYVQDPRGKRPALDDNFNPWAVSGAERTAETMRSYNEGDVFGGALSWIKFTVTAEGDIAIMARIPQIAQGGNDGARARFKLRITGASEPVSMQFGHRPNGPGTSGQVYWSGGDDFAPDVVHEIDVTGQAPGGSNAMFMIRASDPGAGVSFEIAELLVEKGATGSSTYPHAPGYFDGGFDDDQSGDVIYDWTGTPNESASIASVRTGPAEWVPWEPGDVLYMDGAMLTLGSGLFDYFDGDTPDTNEYDYEWLGTPHASASQRSETGFEAEDEDPLLDPDCPPFPKPPRPPIVDPDCIAAVDRWRRVWVRVRDEEVAEWAPTMPTFILRSNQAVRQMRIRIYANPDSLDPSEVPLDAMQSELIVSYMPPNTVLTIDAAMQRVYAEVAGGQRLPADHLLYGSDGEPPVWPSFDCGAEYLVAMDTDASLPLGAIEPVEVWTRRMVM